MAERAEIAGTPALRLFLQRNTKISFLQIFVFKERQITWV